MQRALWIACATCMSPRGFNPVFTNNSCSSACAALRRRPVTPFTMHGWKGCGRRKRLEGVFVVSASFRKLQLSTHVLYSARFGELALSQIRQAWPRGLEKVALSFAECETSFFQLMLLSGPRRYPYMSRCLHETPLLDAHYANMYLRRCMFAVGVYASLIDVNVRSALGAQQPIL
jgi:hypothetical protein